MPGDLNCTSPSGAMRKSTFGAGGPTASERTAPSACAVTIEKGFGLAVELLQVEAERAIEGEEIGADRLARGIGDADAREAERVLQRAVDQEIAEPVGEPRESGTARR